MKNIIIGLIVLCFSSCIDTGIEDTLNINPDGSAKIDIKMNLDKSAGAERVLKKNLKMNNGIVYYKSNLFTGIAFDNYNTEQLRFEGNYKDGKLDGLWKSWHQNGQLSSVSNYKDGKREGISKHWHNNGQLKCEYNYKNGKKDSLTKCWYYDGQLSSVSDYKDENLVHRQTYSYYDNGKIKSESYYEEGYVANSVKYWKSSGELESEIVPENKQGDPVLETVILYNKHGKKRCSFNFGVVEQEVGLYKIWYNNGQLEEQGNYASCPIEGECYALKYIKRWHNNGQLKQDIKFDISKGESILIQEKCWDTNGNKITCSYNRHISKELLDSIKNIKFYDYTVNVLY